jgi:hypothetical protein
LISTGENVIFVLTRRMERGSFERASADRLDKLRPISPVAFGTRTHVRHVLAKTGADSIFATNYEVG